MGFAYRDSESEHICDDEVTNSSTSANGCADWMYTD